MKKYCPKIAAHRQVLPQIAHGLSRKLYPKLARTKITSILTERNHSNALTVLAKWFLKESGKHLRNLTRREAQQYLIKRSYEVRQKTLDLDRQVINMHFCFGSKMDYVVSHVLTPHENRAYSALQIGYLLSVAPPDLRLSIELALDAGLRSMELITLGKMTDRLPSDRSWHPNKFDGRESDLPYSTFGKGGLGREIRLSPALAQVLITLQRPEPVTVSHCGAHQKSFFKLLGGNAFCRKFSRLSKKHLGFSHGAHGLRYMFAQKRFIDLICVAHPPGEALKILAQEMGHFSINNTLVYLHKRFDADGRIVPVQDISTLNKT